MFYGHPLKQSWDGCLPNFPCNVSFPTLPVHCTMQEAYIYIFLWDPGKLKREPPLVFWLVPTKFGCVAGRKHTVGKASLQSFAGDRHARSGSLDPRAVSSLNRLLTHLPCFRLLCFSLSCVYSSVFLTNLHIFESSSKLCGFLKLFLIFFWEWIFFQNNSLLLKKKSRNNDGFSLAFLASLSTLS